MRLVLACHMLALAACSAPAAPDMTGAPEQKPEVIVDTGPETIETPSRSESPFTPDTMQAVLDETGSTNVLERLTHPDKPDNSEWNDVLTGMASGDPEWLRLAGPLHRRLRDTSQTEALGRLTAALQQALISKPADVLGLMHSKMLFPKSICHSGQFDPADEAQIARKAAVIDALNSLDYRYTYPHFKDERDGCLRAIESNTEPGQIP